ncbi:MAG TPA: acylphosphatase [Kineosporiaceae bacterium]|nr:acylphosphatase [Kineosporiaceae bacterium]
MDRQPVPAPPRWASAAAKAVRLTVWVRGEVQGVGFRWWSRSRGLELGLTGTATNLRDGRVEIVAEGTRQACDQLLVWLTEEPSTKARPGSVTDVTHRWSAPTGALRGFRER